ncbi:MAG: amidase [Acidimicrobiales bacterium]|nr:amidase [Acidimicrobiales bacterium]
MTSTAWEDPDPIGAFVDGKRVLALGASEGPLAGTEFAVKDLFDVAGTRTGAGNPQWREAAVPARVHARSVAALLTAGADLVGKTVSDELAFSLSGTNVHYGTPTNVNAPGRIPGGSSSGSAAAVAAGEVDLALGTDTGGSVRVPASYCGIFGLRPSHGRIDRSGVFLLAPSFCTVGLFARDPSLLGEGWRALDRHGRDDTFTPRPSRVPTALVAVPELFELVDESQQEALFARAGRYASAAGIPLRTGHLAEDQEALASFLGAFRTIQMIEAWQLHGRWIRAGRPRLGPGISARFEEASRVDPGLLDGARQRRAELSFRLARLLGDGAYLIQPAASGPPPPLDVAGEEKASLRARTLALTCVAGLAGAPALAVPGRSTGGLPLGLVLVGCPGDDEGLIGLAASVPASM